MKGVALRLLAPVLIVALLAAESAALNGPCCLGAVLNRAGSSSLACPHTDASPSCCRSHAAPSPPCCAAHNPARVLRDTGAGCSCSAPSALSATKETEPELCSDPLPAPGLPMAAACAAPARAAGPSGQAPFHSTAGPPITVLGMSFRL